MTRSPKPRPWADIKIISNDRMEQNEIALVSGGNVTVANLDDSTTENLRGTKLTRFKRWILREGRS